MSDFILKDFKAEEHFEEVSTWWKFWRWTNHPTPALLSTIGYIVEKDGLILCAGWLYTTNSGMAFIEFVVKNPFAEEDNSSVLFLIEHLFQRAVAEGAVIAWSVHKNNFLATMLEQCAFKPAAQNYTWCFRIAGGAHG